MFQIASFEARKELLAELTTMRMRMIPLSRIFLMEVRMIPVSRKLLMEAEELVRWREGCFPPTEQRLSGSDESAKH